MLAGIIDAPGGSNDAGVGSAPWSEPSSDESDSRSISSSAPRLVARWLSSVNAAASPLATAGAEGLSTLAGGNDDDGAGRELVAGGNDDDGAGRDVVAGGNDDDGAGRDVVAGGNDDDGAGRDVVAGGSTADAGLDFVVGGDDDAPAAPALIAVPACGVGVVAAVMMTRAPIASRSRA